MTHEEKVSELEIKAAVLNEKVKRLEWIIYGILAFVFMQLIWTFYFMG